MMKLPETLQILKWRKLDDSCLTSLPNTFLLVKNAVQNIEIHKIIIDTKL